jgi:hypothetical protein
MHPYVYDNSWEEFMFDDKAASQRLFRSMILDFVRFNPKGCFYHRTGLQEDKGLGEQAQAPMKILDFVLPIKLTAEAIGVGLALAKAMGCAAETQLSFGFRWSKLQNRMLVSWNPERHLWPRGPAHQDVVTSYINLPLDTPLSAVSDYVDQVVQPLFQIFDGFSLDKSVVEDLTRRTLERKR